MKRIYTLLAAVLLSTILWAQAPQSFSYQAVVRGFNNELVVNKPVGMKVSLLQGSENGASVYVETHTPTANSNGLISISIGAGTKIVGDFDKIEWAKGPYFVKTETDLTGGTSYSLTSISQLLSVPYALYAANSQPGPKGDKGDAGKDGVDGKDGAQGPIGPKGDTGAVGPQGIPGKDGVDGKDGLIGPKGDKGDVGEKGAKGDVGIQGPAGNDGIVGPKGEKGDKGDTPEVKVTVSLEGDTLRFENGSYVIIPGISAANPKSKPTSGYGPNISDVDGNTYKTVYIGTQLWMAENLKVTKFNDGTSMSSITTLDQLTTLTIPAWCYYNYDVSNNLNYGKIYNYYTISLTSKNVCPTGWHIPTEAEWRVLIDFLGGHSIAFDKLKESGNTKWLGNNSATNSSLFTALPGGKISVNGFDGKNYSGYWWTATVINNNFNFWVYSIGANRIMNLDNGVKASGYSIRCLKD